MAIKKWFILLGLTCWGLTSCQPASISPTSTVAIVSATNTPQPTNTFLATSTLTPTFTPVPPTPTIIPSDVLTGYLENARIVGYDNFDSPLGWNASNEISNGVMKLTGLGGDDWRGPANNASFRENEGVVINFKFTHGAFFEMFFENGQWETESYRRFGAYISQGSAQTQFFTGLKGINPYRLPGNLILNAETWYSIFMVTGIDGDLLALIWDPSKPARYLRYRETLGNWKGINWTFRIQANEGTIIFDDFEEIEFDEIK